MCIRDSQDLDNIVAPSTTELIRHETDDSELVPVIVERRILGAWLDHIYKDERILREFAVLEHEDRRVRFQELDELSIQTAENEVRRKVFENYLPWGTDGKVAHRAARLS